jgi:hypothetical protein
MEAVLIQSAHSQPSIVPAPKWRRWGSVALSALAVLFLLFDSTMKLLKVQPVAEAMSRMGYPDATARPIGLILLACIVLYVVPRTAVLGAVLLTGYLGGAIATHVRVEDPLFSHTLFPVYFAVLIWGSLYLRDARVRALAPWNSQSRVRRASAAS